jgi:hypothetical protein
MNNNDRIYRISCPHCKNWINVSDLIPNNTNISFFADFKLNEGTFERGRCFASITGLKQKQKNKHKDIVFDKKENVKELL